MRILLFLALLPAAAGFARASDGLTDALAARSMLGPDVWARVVRIENGAARGALRRSPYPSTVYALVFELSGILWFYSDADGTQSLSTRRSSLDADKADPGPLFRAISDRFGSWAWVDDPPGWRAPPPMPPPNACLIECVAALRRRIAVGEEAGSPRLLFFYVDTPNGRLGHTVLLIGSGAGLTAVDPAKPEDPIRLPAYLGANARSVSRYLRGGEVASARILPIGAPGETRRAARWAALPPPAVPAG